MDEYEGASKLWSLIGQVPARAIFLAKFLSKTTLASLTFGVVGGQVGAFLFPCGPLLPHLVSSWVGFTVSALHFYHQEHEIAAMRARDYPALMLHSLHTNFPHVLAGGRYALRGGAVTLPRPSPALSMPVAGADLRPEAGPELVALMSNSMAFRAWATLASQAMTRHVEQIEQARMQALVDAYSTATAPDPE